MFPPFVQIMSGEQNKMKTTKRITSVFIALMMVASMIMTMEVKGATQKPKLNKKSVVLEVGKSVTLKVISADEYTVKWTTSDKKVVTVTKKGKVNAKKVGKATVSAKVSQSNGKEITLKCKVTVEKTDYKEVVPGSLSHDGYSVKQVIVLSRHNIRSPLSGGDSLLGKITPHTWFTWTSNPSELSLRGGVLETENGQYFRKWLEKEQLFPENYHPDEDAVAVYANSKQRTIATARYFIAGLLPTANKRIEYKVDFDKMDPVFTPQFTFVTDEYGDACAEQMKSIFNKKVDKLKEDYKLLSDVLDLKDSEAYKDGTIGEFKTDDLGLSIGVGKEPGMTGSLKDACSAADALVLQYYEEADEKKAAFGKKLTKDQWDMISEIKDVYGDVLFTAPLVSVNVANPLLKEIKKEMNTEGRKFTFLCGHDSNVGSVLAAMGAADYELPCTIEKKTPIGVKLVFTKYEKDGKEAWSVDLVYQTTDQLRQLTLLTLENHPAVYSIDLEGLTKNESGLYEGKAVEERIDEALKKYDDMVTEYSQKKAA